MNFNLTNATVNATVSAFGQGFPPPSDAGKVGKTILVGAIVISSLLGNSLVICAVFQRQRMRTITNYLIVNVSISDLLYTIVVTPPQIVQIFGLYNWALGGFAIATLFCKVINYLQLTFVTSSLLTLAALALDRYFAVISPLKRTITKPVFAGILCAIWLIAAAVCSPILYSMRVVDKSGTLSCAEIWVDDEEKSLAASRGYTITLFVVMYCVPLLTMSILYSRISWFLWLRRTPGTQLEANQRKAEKSKKKVVKMLITVVFAFICCWLPLQVVTFVVFYVSAAVSPGLYFLCETLMRINACLNPLIYAVFSENYREAFKDVVLSCVYGRRKFQRVPSQTARSTMVSHTHYNNLGPTSPAMEMKGITQELACSE